MALLEKILGKYLETWLFANENYLAAAAGTGADFEQPLLAVPTVATPTGFSGLAPKNRMKLRSVMIVPSAAITGAATNYFTLNVNWWRNGAKVQAAALCSVSFQAGTNGVQHAPINLTPVDATGKSSVILLPGDSITIQRVSTGTGLASPLFVAIGEYVPVDTYPVSQ